MTKPEGIRVNKEVMVETSLTDEPDDKSYWLSRSTEERFAAIESLRQVLYGYETAPRLQRVLEVIGRSQD
jgi:hypothetical protein